MNNSGASAGYEPAAAAQLATDWNQYTRNSKSTRGYRRKTHNGYSLRVPVHTKTQSAKHEFELSNTIGTFANNACLVWKL
jgi:hypothetical protein